MTELTFEKMNIGFAVFAAAVFVWASIDYNRFIKFWMVRPAPYSKPVTVAFRLFFLACVVGGAWHVVDIAMASRLPLTAYFGVVPFAVGWFAVFVLMVHVVEWMKRKQVANRSRR
jgi:hypothetical protein